MKKVKILSFDTTNQKCSAAIYENDTILAERHCNKPNSQAEMLFSLIESALNDAKQNFSDIDFLAVTTGPGSFTGVRIGLASAYGIIAASPNINPIAITSLEAINFRAMEHVKNYDSSVVFMNAFSEQLYAQTFDAYGNYTSEPCVIYIKDVDKYLNDIKGKIVITGSGLEFLPENLLNIERVIALPRFPSPEARTVARTAYHKIKNNKHIRSQDMVPLYIKPPYTSISAK